MPTSRLRGSLAAALLVASLLLVACGSDSDGAADPSGAGSGTEASGSGGGAGETAFPATVEHRFGTTEVAAKPQRIVSLDSQWTDILLALDAPPVGYLADPTTDDGSFPWRGDELDDATQITATDALPYEQIAALEPDLIVITYLAADEGAYEKLAQIAPTIASLGDEVDPWQDLAEVAGTVLDQPDEAAELVADVDGQVQAVADELPGLEGKTFALANFVPGDSIAVVADPDDGANVLFAQLGLEITPTILEAGPAESGRVTLSLEQVELLDGDLLVLLTNGADPDDIVGYEQLPAVRSGAVAVLDYADIVGLNTPSPLSVPYSLELIRPALEAAAG